ncbi:unnamed protein product [Cylicostephanus goldi]|uniref:Uncharacterized protein n=1 Tax=Cylicostephanus goldi TaxID=71465 RepID=A0A3P6TN72_CYLGO|nr:unnamed protein product [Cylicostephanus goldi]
MVSLARMEILEHTETQDHQEAVEKGVSVPNTALSMEESSSRMAAGVEFSFRQRTHIFCTAAYKVKFLLSSFC